MGTNAAIERSKFAQTVKTHHAYTIVAGCFVLGMVISAYAYTTGGKLDEESYAEVVSAQVFVPKRVSYNEYAITALLIDPENQKGNVREPKEVRGIYMTAYTASDLKRRTKLLEYVKRNDLNAIVIDIKEGSGKPAFPSRTAGMENAKGRDVLLNDLPLFLEELRTAGIYRIARQQVFLDNWYATRYPAYALKYGSGALWRDRTGSAWLDPASRDVWKYNADLAQEAYDLGFDEVQFDYVRFPSDGSVSSITFPFRKATESRSSVMKSFFAYMDETLRKKGVKVSYDLFGLVMWHQSDLGVGQRLEDSLPYADAISPMVYPSHYFSGTLGFTNPAKYPYEIVVDSMKKGNEKREELLNACSTETDPCEMAQFRPWIQAFDMGAVYTRDMINAQVKASREQHAGGFLLWNANNSYRDIVPLPTVDN